MFFKGCNVDVINLEITYLLGDQEPFRSNELRVFYILCTSFLGFQRPLANNIKQIYGALVTVRVGVNDFTYSYKSSPTCVRQKSVPGHRFLSAARAQLYRAGMQLLA